MKILVTGGAGYIGSHTCLELLEKGYDVTVVDNLSNSSRESLNRIEALTGKSIDFRCVDLLDRSALENVIKEGGFFSVIHFAGLKAVGESVSIPLKYYHNNVTGTIVLCELMDKYGLRNIVFSSSATVYGDPHTVPIREDFPLGCTNPYGRTKLMIEEILSDIYTADSRWNITLLRYFNPVGAHISGRIGEDPRGIPNNLMPYISQVHVGKLKELSIFGNDYPTHDGTGVRDYIHVVDLAKGHLKALEKIEGNPGLSIYNLGTGKGYSVLDMVRAYEKASGGTIPFKFTARRPGDIAECYADPGKANRDLGWTAQLTVDDMCRDALRWQTGNPDGYRS
jgi:UDP-glucose 4-epimerase